MEDKLQTSAAKKLVSEQAYDIEFVDPLRNNALLAAVRSGTLTKSKAEVLDDITLAIAEDLAYISHARDTLYATTQAVPVKVIEAHMKGVKMLSDMVSEQSKREQTEGTVQVDFASKNFEKVMAYFFHKVKQSMDDAKVADAQVRMVFKALQNKIEGFEDKASKLYNTATTVEEVLEQEKAETIEG